MAEALRTAVEAKNADAVANAYASLGASEPVDLKLLCAACNLMAFHRHNADAFSAFQRGMSLSQGGDEGGPLVAAGLNLNALLYASCRDPSMLDSARKASRPCDDELSRPTFADQTPPCLAGHSATRPPAPPADLSLAAADGPFSLA